jgi:aldehyde dehydrogenase (NAD+)
MGDPFDPDTDIGPLISARQRDRVEGYIKLAREEGATVAIGGGRPVDLDRGWFVEPTVLVNATNDMQSSREEIFGPVGSVVTYSDLEEGISIVNDSNYGLSSAVFSGDLEFANDVAKRLRTGTVCLNTISYDDAFPFGGYKDSGIGRQNGPEGIAEYLEMKTIGRP